MFFPVYGGWLGVWILKKISDECFDVPHLNKFIFLILIPTQNSIWCHKPNIILFPELVIRRQAQTTIVLNVKIQAKWNFG